MSNTTIPVVAVPPNWIDVYDTPYSNQYNTVANAFFLGLISISLAGCFLLACKTRRAVPFSFFLCVALLMELIAYALRFQDWSMDNFTASLGLSTIAPIFVTIAIHLSSAQVITNLGAEHAPLSPNAHLRLFVWTDVLAFLLQAIGLAVAFSGAQPAGSTSWRIVLPPQAAAGQSVLFAGLLVQCLGLAGALACLTATYMRAGHADHKYAAYSTPSFPRGNGNGALPLTPRSKIFLAILPLAGVCVLVRCAYRAAAAWDGLASPVTRDNVLWLVAEGVLLTEALVTLAVFHPAIWLEDDDDKTRRRRDNDMEEAAAGPGARAADKMTRSSLFSMGSYGYSTRAAKRLSYATSIGDMREPEHAHMQPPPQQRDGDDDEEGNPSRAAAADLHHHDEASQLMFQSRLIAPSDAGSSRRGSSGSSQPDPYLHLHRPGLYDEDASPYDDASPRGRNHRYDDDAHVRISPDTRDLSPLEAEAEADRVSIAPEVPRKSSKRVSRLLSPGSGSDAVATSSIGASTDDEDDDDDDDESFVEVPRKSSKRVSRLLVPPTPAAHDDEDDYDDDDRLDVESVILPLRKPSQKETTTEDDDEAVEQATLKSKYSVASMYSQ